MVGVVVGVVVGGVVGLIVGFVVGSVDGAVTTVAGVVLGVVVESAIVAAVVGVAVGVVVGSFSLVAVSQPLIPKDVRHTNTSNRQNSFFEFFINCYTSYGELSCIIVNVFA